ncbi:MAG: hypothetical protein IPK62_02080 [Bacteroidetes bacterium]|nr:hypothetical protein [Bacteroidota bacterium]
MSIIIKEIYRVGKVVDKLDSKTDFIIEGISSMSDILKSIIGNSSIKAFYLDRIKKIIKHIEELKIETAKEEILDLINSPTTTNEILSNEEFANLYQLLGQCAELLNEESSKWYFKAQQYLPLKSEIEIQIAFHYFYKSDKESARKIVDEVLKTDSVNPIANALIVLIENSGDIQFVLSNTKEEVLNDIRFTFPIFFGIYSIETPILWKFQDC